ncbi:MAG: hypothetical protein ACR2O3_17735 [Rhizobiaceae bacterium]
MGSPLDYSYDQLNFRPPEKVMRLKRMGSFHQSRLSFMRVLLRRLKENNWTFDRPIFSIDEKGVGVATYRAIGPERTYTLVAFAHDLPDDKRSDRVIAEAWDATFTLVDGEPSEQDIDRLSKNVPLQEAGRISGKELSLSRANKSVRLFTHVLDRLSNGRQPDAEEIEKVGYLMRTTAVYGSGKFGASDRAIWADRPEFAGSFQPELLSVWLTRSFAIDWIEHLAAAKGGERAVKMDPVLRRRLGIGNSTGLGMAPFLINHPSLIHAWINARETALARVCNIKSAVDSETETFVDLMKRARQNANHWHTAHEHQKAKVACLRKDFEALELAVEGGILDCKYPWKALEQWSTENLGFEGQEQVVSLMLEPYGHLVDELAATMCADESSVFRIDGAMLIEEFGQKLDQLYGWASAIDFEDKSASARIWYTSEEKLEPRLGERYEEDLGSYEQPLAPARDAMRLKASLKDWDVRQTMAAFLLKHPEHRHMVRRIQMLSDCPYGEIRDNTIDAELMPIDLLRCKLSFFGATRFDPRSDRWVRITMYQDAPYAEELSSLDPDECAYPELETV